MAAAASGRGPLPRPTAGRRARPCRGRRVEGGAAGSARRRAGGRGGGRRASGAFRDVARALRGPRGAAALLSRPPRVPRRRRRGDVGGRARGPGRHHREGSGEARWARRRGARPRPAREPRGGRRRPAARPPGGRVSARRVAFHPICRYRRHALTARGKTEPMSTQAGPALLVAQTSFLGDVVLTTPLLTALRERLRPRRLAVLVRPEAVPLLDGHPDVDAVIVDDKRGGERGLGGLGRVAGRPRRDRVHLGGAPPRAP